MTGLHREPLGHAGGTTTPGGPPGALPLPLSEHDRAYPLGTLAGPPGGR